MAKDFCVKETWMVKTIKDAVDLTSTLVLRSLCNDMFLGSIEYCVKILYGLKRRGIVRIISYGPIASSGIRIIGKGWSSIVFLAVNEANKIYAVKARRFTARRLTLLNEAMYLSVLSLYRISPRVYDYERDFVIMEPLLGANLTSIIFRDDALCKYVLRRILWKLYLMDRMGIRHNELSRPRGHILFDCSGEPYIIDFESATLGGKPRNVPQFVGAIVSGRVSFPCVRLDKEFKHSLNKMVKEYKLNPSLHIFNKLVDAIVGMSKLSNH